LHQVFVEHHAAQTEACVTTHCVPLIIAVLLLALAGVAVVFKGAKEGRAPWFLYLALAVTTGSMLALVIITIFPAAR
jgi:zinc transporter ZupT